MNRFFAIGNLGSNPVLRSTPSGKDVCNFSIAVDHHYYRSSGDDREHVKETNWVPVVVWEGLARTCAEYLQTGSKVAVEGRLQSRTFTDQSGVNHRVFEIVASSVEFLGKIRSSSPEVEASATA